MTESTCLFGNIWTEHEIFVFVGGANALNLLSAFLYVDLVSKPNSYGKTHVPLH